MKLDKYMITDDSANIKKAIKSVFNETKQKYIHLDFGKNLTAEDNNYKSVIRTKIGGIPWWPANMANRYPRDDKGEEMVLLAQLNFGKLPKLNNFPTKGLLQFFLALDDTYGAWIKNGYRVVYHNLSEIEMSDFQIYQPKITSLKFQQYSDDMFPVSGCYYPEAEIKTGGLNVTCDDYFPKICQYLNKIYGESWRDFRDIPKNLIDDIYRDQPNVNYGDLNTVGGYPYFIQNDDRKDEKDVLLLQIDSYDKISWGDSGTAQFMISPENLKAKKFDRTYYRWACY